jgi:DnaK suppressor protein
VNIEQYREILLAKERELASRIGRAHESARERSEEEVRDLGDVSVDGEVKEEQFQEADTDWAVLNQVRDALKRIEDGTFGKCVVDGRPIEEKRLEAVPWTPYCIKHQKMLEESRPTRTPTL